MTLHAYVIGYPIAHSLSPAIHNAAFAALGIDARYEAVEVEPGRLADWVDGIRNDATLGFNVTLPHKEAVIPLLNGVEGDAQLTRAVNAVRVTPATGGAGLFGNNTDAVGFRTMLAAEAATSFKGKRVVLLGAGGGARAVGLVAVQDGAVTLTVLNRTLERAQKLVDDLRALASSTELAVGVLESGSAALLNADVIVNATSVGLKAGETPIELERVSGSTLVVDLIYNPKETELLRLARVQGARVLGGLGMLVHQAAAAFELWTRQSAPVEVMRAAAEEALRMRAHA